MSVRPRFCKYCGKPFEEGHRYCARCGKPILPPEQDAGDLAQEVAEMSSAALCEVGESADMQQEPAAVADVELAEAECADDAVESQAEEAAEPQAAEELVEPQSAEEPVELLAEELSDSLIEESAELQPEEAAEPQTEELAEPQPEELAEPHLSEEPVEPQAEEVAGPQAEEPVEPQPAELKPEEAAEPQPAEVADSQPEEPSEPHQTDRLPASEEPAASDQGNASEALPSSQDTVPAASDAQPEVPSEELAHEDGITPVRRFVAPDVAERREREQKRTVRVSPVIVSAVVLVCFLALMFYGLYIAVSKLNYSAVDPASTVVAAPLADGSTDGASEDASA